MKKYLIKKIIIGLFALLFLTSCAKSKNDGANYAMVETTDTLSFPLHKGVDIVMDIFIQSLYVHTDADGQEYLTFRDSHYEPRIFVYDMANPSEEPRVITFEKEGPNGTGAVSVGYYISSWKEIYIPNLFVPEISVIDSTGTKTKTIMLGEGYSSLLTYTSSVSKNPFVKYRNHLYAEQMVNFRLGAEMSSTPPVDVVINLNDFSHQPSSFNFPQKLLYWGENGKTGILQHAFKCSNENLLVYSFAYDEKIYVYDMDQDKLVRTVDARSKFIPKPSVLDYDYRFEQASYADFKDICAEACYGNILHDPYRHLYYRIVYPETKVDAAENFTDLYRSGRSLFSIMVLDEEFNVLGETLLPENQFRSNLLFINKDGLWISCNHYKNPRYDEENLNFIRFELN